MNHLCVLRACRSTRPGAAPAAGVRAGEPTCTAPRPPRRALTARRYAPAGVPEHPSPAVTDPWGVDRLDLDAYLARLGVAPTPTRRSPRSTAPTSPRSRSRTSTCSSASRSASTCRTSRPSSSTPAAAATATSTPSCSPPRSNGSASPSNGGWPASATPRSRPGHARTWSSLVDGRWLADTGFGSGLLEPVPLVDGHVTQQGGWTFRTVRLDDGSWQLHELRDGYLADPLHDPARDHLPGRRRGRQLRDVAPADVPVRAAGRGDPQGRGTACAP